MHLQVVTHRLVYHLPHPLLDMFKDAGHFNEADFSVFDLCSQVTALDWPPISPPELATHSFELFWIRATINIRGTIESCKGTTKSILHEYHRDVF